MTRFQSASQTAGPYVHIGCTPSFAGLENMYGGHDLGADIFSPDTPGTWVTVSGRIFDGEGMPVTDARGIRRLGPQSGGRSGSKLFCEHHPARRGGR